MKKYFVIFIIAIISIICSITLVFADNTTIVVTNFEQVEYEKNSTMQMALFSQQSDLMAKNKTFITENYLDKYLYHNAINTSSGTQAYNSNYRRLMCSHILNNNYGSNRKNSKNNWLILDVLDLGYYGGNGDSSDLRSPTFIYSYKKAQENPEYAGNYGGKVVTFLAQQAYRAGSGWNSNDSRTTIDRSVNQIIKDLKNANVLGNDTISKLETTAYTYSDNYDTSKNNNNWGMYEYPSDNKITGFFASTIYDSTKKISSLYEIKTADNKTTGKASINGELVGPFCLKMPSITNEATNFITYDNSNTNSYTVVDSAGSEIEISSDKEFYLKFAEEIPDDITFNFSYQQYYGRIFITFGGHGQDIWIATGDKASNDSTVTYTVQKGTDITTNTYVEYSKYSGNSNGTNPDATSFKSRQNLTEEQKQATPFFAEQGDILKVSIDVKNLSNIDSTVSTIYSSYDSILSLSTDEELAAKWKASLTDNVKNTEWISTDTTNSYATTYYANSEYKQLSKKTLKQDNSISEQLMLTVNGNPKDSVETYTINGNTVLEDITPEDLDETNNSSCDYLKLKTIDAVIEKNLIKSWSTGTTENDKYTVEYGDTVHYMITVRNPIPEGQTEDSVSTIYNTKFIENIPEGLELTAVQQYMGNEQYSNITNTSKVDISDNECEVIISDGIAPGKAAVYVFSYKVTSFGIDPENSDNDYQVIRNTVYLSEYYNRNNFYYQDTDSSSEDIYVKNYKLSVNKYLFTFASNKMPIESGVSGLIDRNTYTEDQKQESPVYVEYGDRLVYEIQVRNDGDTVLKNIQIQDIFDNEDLELENDPIVENIESLNEDITITKNVSVDSSLVTYIIEELAPNKSALIRIKFYADKTLEEGEIDNQILNTARIISAKNSNNIELISQSDSPEENKVYGPLESTEYCIQKLYNVKTSKYVSAYDGSMMNQNINNGLIQKIDEVDDYYEGNLEKFGISRQNLSEQEKEEKPFAVEQSEKITYTIRVENQKNEDSLNDATVYIETIFDYLDEGLTKIDDSFVGTISQNGQRRELVQFTDFSASGIDKYTDTFAITFPETIKLLPGDYIEFKYDVEISASNMKIDVLKNEVILSKITNKNDKVIIDQFGPGEPQIDTNLNPPPTTSKEFVKMKDLVVSGYIWNDLNQNGLKDEGEPGIEGIEVELNALNEDSKENRYTKVYTDANGLYSFGRVFKTNQNNEYENSLYITYQYDGIRYQNTIYSGKENLVYADNSYHMKPNYKIDSNAKEIDIERIDFNNSLKTIYNNYGSEEFEVTEYDKELQYTKTPKTSDNEYSISSRIEDNSDLHTTKIKSYSFLRYDDNLGDVIDCLWFEDLESSSYDIEYLKHINLGLIVRDELDLSISETLESVTNTVFGDSLGYNYEFEELPEFKYYSEDYYYKYTDYQDTKIREYLTQNSELTTQVSYKATIQNGRIDTINNGDSTEEKLVTISDNNVIVQVNELAIYLDNKFVTADTDEDGIVDKISLMKFGTDDILYEDSIGAVKAYYINEDDEKVELNVYTQSIYNPSEVNSNGYNPLYIRTQEESTGIIIPNSSNESINPGTIDIYLTFVDYNRSDNDELLTLNEKYNHVLEITSYSSYYKNNENYYKNNEKYEDNLEIAGNGAGYIDIDSNPGNIGSTDIDGEYIDFFDENIENYDLYDEDDTSRGTIIFIIDSDDPPPDDDDPPPDDDDPPPDDDDPPPDDDDPPPDDDDPPPDDDDPPPDDNDPPSNESIKRKITGIVFDDSRSEEVSEDGQNIQYIGNGLYNLSDTTKENARTNGTRGQTDSPVQDVTVKLYKVIKISEDQYYEIDLSDETKYIKPEEIESKTIALTAEDGSYELNGFTPGTYFTRFVYGNGTENNMLIYNGQDYKSTTLSDLEGEEDSYYNLSKILNNEYLENANKPNNLEFLNNIWTIRVLQEWLLKYYEYNSDEEWYTAMIEDYKSYSNLEQGFVNGFSMLGSYYSSAYGPEYQDNITYQLLTIIGNDVLNNKMSYPEFDILEVMYENLNYSDIVKIYRNEIINYIENTEGSNAIDDALRRLETIRYASEINNTKAEILVSAAKLIQLRNDETIPDYQKNTKLEMYESLAELMVLNTNMYADSIEFYVRAEDVNYDFENTNENDIQYIDHEIRPDVLYSLNNLSFGLQYRPETELTLREYIKEISLVTSAGGEKLVSLHFNEDRTLRDDVENRGLENVLSLDTTYENQNNGTYSAQKGFKFINLDEIFLQGALLQITYGIYIDNTGEIDRIGSNLYNESFTKNEYQEHLDSVISEYERNYYVQTEDMQEYRTKPKDYLEYYKQYLGNVYYTGRIESDDGITDVVVKAKINQVVNDIDGEILFDEAINSQEWEYVDDIKDMMDKGSYLFIEDYNMSGTTLTVEDNNSFMNNFIIILANKNLKLYKQYEELYGDEAFVQWYKAMITEFKTYSYLEQGIVNSFGMGLSNFFIDKTHAQGNYQNNIAYQFLNQIGTDAFMNRVDLEDPNSYKEIINILLKDEFIDTDQEITQEEIQSVLSEIDIQSILDEINFEINIEKIVIQNENGDLYGMKKVVSTHLDEDINGNEYNTTYNFITPKQSETDISSQTRVTLDITTQREITSDILNHAELSFDNASEIINYTSINGRRTSYTTTVGNGIEDEIDSDSSVEYVTFTKPTGLSLTEQKLYTVRTGMIWLVVIGVTILITSCIVYIIKKRKSKIHFIK